MAPETRFMIFEHFTFLPGNMHLSRDNVVAHIVREIFQVSDSSNSLASEICRLFTLIVIDVNRKSFHGLYIEEP